MAKYIDHVDLAVLAEPENIVVSVGFVDLASINDITVITNYYYSRPCRPSQQSVEPCTVP